MMAKLVVFFVTLIVVYVNSAAVTPVAKAQENNIQNQINQMVLQVQTIANNVTTVATTLLNVLPNNKQITDGIISQTQQLSQVVVGLIGRIQSEIKDNRGNLDKILKETSVSLNKVLVSVQSLVGIENRSQVRDNRAELDNGLKIGTEEIEKLAKAVQPVFFLDTSKTLQIISKGIIDDFLKAVNNLRTQVSSLPSIGRKFIEEKIALS